MLYLIIFGTWCKLTYENFPFPLEQNYENDYIIYGLFKPKFQYREFLHI
jgi:hypothetical protein